MSAALSMIDRGKWRLCASVVDLVRACTVDNPGLGRGTPVELSGADLSQWLYGHRNNGSSADRLLTRLLTNQVLVAPVPAAGRRGTCYAINGNFRQWRNVPWRHSRELVLLRLDALNTPFLRQEVLVAPTNPYMYVTNLVSAHNRSAKRVNKNSVVPTKAQQKEGTGQNLFPHIGNEGAKSSLHRSSEISRDSVSQSEGVRRVINEIRALTPDGNGVWGEPLAVVERLVLECGQDVTPLLELLANSRTGGMGVPRLVNWLALEWDRSRPNPAARQEYVNKRIETLRAMASAWEDAGQEPDDVVGAEYRAELEQLESEQLDQAGGF